uniref:PH domain-containing protein n=1 Tax=Arcella intermedia TaxID=1963864 RepID=A0A6B2L4B5_9EUKA
MKPQASFEGWATKQGGSHKSWKKRYFLLTSSSNPKIAELYYFKADKAKSAIGVIKINERTVVKDTTNKGKQCIAIESGMIGVRVYLMYCGTSAEHDTMIKALRDKVDSLKTKTEPKPAVGADPSKPAAQATAAAAGVSAGGIKGSLESAKNAIPFLSADGNEDRILEFWQIWTESIPGGSSDVSVTLVMNSDMSQLSWRVYGPQNVLIQEMVDFFWNVGAPEQEIDRLNEVGGLINPLTIGSWIDMSTKGGMDGGWVFPVNVPMEDALKACDDGDPLKKLSHWTKANAITECITVGRDMGASPPRQTEIRFNIKGDNFDARLHVASSAYRDFGFPIPEAYLSILRTWNPASMILSIITSSEGFVRIGMILPNPDRQIVTQICNVGNVDTAKLFAFAQKLKIEKPAFVEFQFLNESFGYGVYNEGLNIVFHFALDGK